MSWNEADAQASGSSCRRVAFRGLFVQSKQKGMPHLPLLGVSLDGVRMRHAADGRPAPSASLDEYKFVRAGDIVMNALGKPHGSIGLSEVEGITSPAYWVLALAPDILPRYAHHLLRSHAMINEYQRLGKNLPPNQFNLEWEKFRTIEVTLPRLGEQRRIAAYLDDQVARIDDIIAARLSQVELARGYSCGAVAELWARLELDFGSARLGYLVSRIEQGWSPNAELRPAPLGEWGVMRAGSLNGGKFNQLDNKALPRDVLPRRQFEIRPGDLLMSRASGSASLIGSVAVVPSDVRSRLILPDKLYRIKPISGVSQHFLMEALRSPGARRVIESGISGAEGMANNLPTGVIRAIRVPLVPVARQARLAQRARILWESADGFRSLAMRSVDRLKELKASLITAAVTGEFDVTTADGSQVPV